MRLIFMALLWGACTGAESPVPVGIPHDALDLSSFQATVEDGWQACASASDCTVMRWGCCDWCNGSGVAIAAVHTKVFEAANPTQPDCSQIGCTAIVCGPNPSATCNQGSCEVAP
jgi:hypothetical protein